MTGVQTCALPICVARVGEGALPAEYVLGEHYRLGSQMVILSRAFCNADKITDLEEMDARFKSGIADIRRCEAELAKADAAFLAENHRLVQEKVAEIVKKCRR